MADDDPVVTVPVPGADYFVRMPRSFVDLTVTDGGPLEVDVPPLDVQRNAIAIRVSREMALDYGLVDPTPEEAAARAAHAEQVRAETARRRAEPGPLLSLDALLEHLGWPAEYAEHVLHPACSCDPLDDDPYLCSWATELGWEITWDSHDGRRVARRG